MFVDIQFVPTGLIWMVIFVISLLISTINGVRRMTLVKFYINSLLIFLPLAVALFHGLALVIHSLENLWLEVLLWGTALFAVMMPLVNTRRNLQNKFIPPVSREMENELLWAEYEKRRKAFQHSKYQYNRKMARKWGKIFGVQIEEEDESDKEYEKQYKASYKKWWLIITLAGLVFVVLLRSGGMVFQESMMLVFLFIAMIGMLAAFVSTVYRIIIIMKQPYRNQ